MLVYDFFSWGVSQIILFFYSKAKVLIMLAFIIVIVHWTIQL